MTRFSRSTVLLLAFLALAGCDSSEERAEKHYQSGLELLEAGDASRAMVEFRNVLALNSSHREARLIYAREARKNGNISESYSNYLRLAEQYPDDMESRLALSEMAILYLNWEEAERHSDAMIKANAEIEGRDVVELALAFRKALADEDAARIRELTREAEALFAERPDNPILHRVLIEGFLAEGEIDKAFDVTNRALAANADNPLYYQVKSQLLAEMNDPVALEDHLRKTIEKFPEEQEVKGDLIRLLVRQGDSQGAEDFLRAQIDTAEDKATAHISLITLIRELRGDDAAMAEIDAALEQYEDNTLLMALKAGIVFDSGRGDDAVTIMQSVVDGAAPSDQTDRLRITLAKMLEATGNDVGARQLVEAVLDRDPGQVEALKMSAGWLIDSDQADEAINTLRRALDQEPEDAEAMTLMARAHERNGDKQLAQDLLALAVEASGNAPDETLRFARLLISQERYSGAEEVLINALRRQPGNLGLLDTLGDVYLATEDWSRAQQVEATLRRLDRREAKLAADDLQLQIISRREGRDSGISFLEDLVDGSDSATAKVALIRARLAEDKGEEALALAQELAAELPDNVQAKLVLGNTQLAVKDFSSAESTFRDILETEDNSIAAMQLVRSLGAQGRTDDAGIMVNELLERMPENADLLWAKASFLERDLDIDGAIGIYERLYAGNSNSPVIANNLASLLATYRQDDESLERAFTVARRLRDTQVPPFQDTFGWILYRRGEVEEALKYLEPAAEALDGDPIVSYHLGKVYAAVNRKEDAIAAFRKALEIAGPDDKRSQFEDAVAEIERLSSASE